MASTIQRLADRPIQSKRVILCEGKDEVDVLCGIRQRRNLGDADVEILDAKGRTNLLTLLGDLPYVSGGSQVKLVSVVLDAEDLGGRDRALMDSLAAAAEQAGWVLKLYVLPDANTPGSFESLIRRAATGQSPEATCADAWTGCIDMAGWTTAQKDKAWSHVWLAGQGLIYQRMGLALQDKPELRGRLATVIQRFDTLLNEVLQTPLG